MRKISGLSFARLCERPGCIPKSLPRGRKAAGLRYERELAKALPAAMHGQWVEFWDAGGKGWCQPDLILDTQLGLVVLEAKYTWTEEGHQQIERLYVPVLEKIFARPVVGMVVCRTLVPEVELGWVCRDLDSAIRRAASGHRTVLHWIGSGLGPLKVTPIHGPIDNTLSSL